MKDELNTINVATSVAPIIGSRDVVRVLRDDIMRVSADAVNLDFEYVEFISRSAAHELLTMKEDLKRETSNPKEIFFIRTSKDVTDMLRTVAASRAVPAEKPELEVKTIDIRSL